MFSREAVSSSEGQRFLLSIIIYTSSVDEVHEFLTQVARVWPLL